MGNVIFCKTRYQDIGYHSYNDLWRMVELAGYPIIYVDQIDPQSDNTYIVTPLNDEWLNGWQSPKARIIHWELEWRTDWRANVNTPQGIAETWVSDKAYADKIGARYVPMGGDARLNEVNQPVTHTLYDVALLSYQTPRRQVITQQLQQQGVTIAPNSGLHKWARSMVLNQCSVMCHTHQTEQSNGVAPLRWCIAAAHKLALISETVPDRGIFGYSHMMQADYDYLASFTSGVLMDKRLLNDYALALHDLLCRDYTFKIGVEKHV